MNEYGLYQINIGNKSTDCLNPTISGNKANKKRIILIQIVSVISQLFAFHLFFKLNTYSFPQINS